MIRHDQILILLSVILLAGCSVEPRREAAPVRDPKKVTVVEPKDNRSPEVVSSRTGGAPVLGVAPPGIATARLNEPEIEVVAYQPPPKVTVAPAHPPLVQGALDAADELEKAGNHDEAIAVLEQGAQSSPRNPYLYNRLAQIWLSKGDPQQAEQFALKSNTYAVGDPMLKESNFRTIAEARRASGDFAGAQAAEREAGVAP